MKGIQKAKNGTGWTVVARVRVNGKIRQKRKTIQGTKEQAKTYREQMKDAIRSGRSISSSLTYDFTTYKNIVDLYKEKKGPFSAQHGYNVDRLEKEFGGMDIRSFPDAFERYLMEFRQQNKDVQANRFITVVKAQFQLAKDLEKIQANPISDLRFPKSEEIPRDTYVQPDGVSKIILTAAKNRKTYHIARALQYYFQVPCRKSEVVAMTIGDIDFFRNRVRVRNGLTKNDEGIWKPIPPNMRKWFLRRKREARSLNEPIFGRYIECRDEFVGLGDFKGAWKSVREATGNMHLTIHDSRHITATNMINNGTPRPVVNAVAGWKTDMLRTYYHLDNDASLEQIQWTRYNANTHKREASVKPEKQAGE